MAQRNDGPKMTKGLRAMMNKPFGGMTRTRSSSEHTRDRQEGVKGSRTASVPRDPSAGKGYGVNSRGENMTSDPFAIQAQARALRRSSDARGKDGATSVTTTAHRGGEYLPNPGVSIRRDLYQSSPKGDQEQRVKAADAIKTMQQHNPDSREWKIAQGVLKNSAGALGVSVQALQEDHALGKLTRSSHAVNGTPQSVGTKTTTDHRGPQTSDARSTAALRDLNNPPKLPPEMKSTSDAHALERAKMLAEKHGPGSASAKRYERMKKARGGGGGGGGDQPRVPAGSPDGGEWTKA